MEKVELFLQVIRARGLMARMMYVRDRIDNMIRAEHKTVNAIIGDNLLGTFTPHHITVERTQHLVNISDGIKAELLAMHEVARLSYFTEEVYSRCSQLSNTFTIKNLTDVEWLARIIDYGDYDERTYYDATTAAIGYRVISLDDYSSDASVFVMAPAHTDIDFRNHAKLVDFDIPGVVFFNVYAGEGCPNLNGHTASTIDRIAVAKPTTIQQVIFADV